MTNLRDIAKAYGGDVRGNAARIPTPGHSAKDRGTVVTVSSDAPDGVVVHSFNGGDPLAIKDMLRSDGFLPEWKAPERKMKFGPAIAATAAPFEPTSIFEYVTIDGIVRYRKVRIDSADGSKTFTCQHQVDGVWTAGRNGDPLLYRLLDIVAKPDAVIYMAEGERKADKLAHWGFVATSSKDLPDDLAPYLKGRTVVVLPDNDEQGRKIADKALQALKEAGAHPFIVTLPGLPEKGDIIDWDGDAVKLEQLANQAMHSQDDYALPVQWFNDVSPILSGQWLVKKLLPANGLALVYGHPGSGKSFFAFDIAAHVALGWDWRGRQVKQGLVVYVGAEGAAGLQNRIASFRQHHGVNQPVPLLLIPSPIDLQNPDTDTKKLAQVIRKASRDCGHEPALIVIDTLSKTFGAGKENTDDMATYVANCGSIASQFNACVMPVHHRPKDAESTEPRGHSSLKGGVDTVILIEGHKIRKASATKQKDAELGDPIFFNLQPVLLGLDEDGEEVTSCVVVAVDFVDSFLSTTKVKLNDNQRVMMAQLHKLLEHNGVPVPADIPDTVIDRQVFTKVALLKDWSDSCVLAFGENPDRKPDSNRRTFDRTRARLQALKIIDVFGEYVWER